MKRKFTVPLLAFLLLSTAGRGLALTEVEHVSRERAKALGVSFRTNVYGEAGTKVWMEFKPEGELKDIASAELQIFEGGKQIVRAPLSMTRSASNQVTVSFLADAAYLPESMLFMVSDNRGLGRTAYQFKVWDFIGPPPAAKKPARNVMPTYVTAEAVKNMPASKATLQDRGACYAVFKNAEGKQFVIGDPSSGPDLTRFIKSLEDGKTYNLPGAFLEYQKNHKP